MKNTSFILIDFDSSDSPLIFSGLYGHSPSPITYQFEKDFDQSIRIILKQEIIKSLERLKTTVEDQSIHHILLSAHYGNPTRWGAQAQLNSSSQEITLKVDAKVIRWFWEKSYFGNTSPSVHDFAFDHALVAAWSERNPSYFADLDFEAPDFLPLLLKRSWEWGITALPSFLRGFNSSGWLEISLQQLRFWQDHYFAQIGYTIKSTPARLARPSADFEPSQVDPLDYAPWTYLHALAIEAELNQNSNLLDLVKKTAFRNPITEIEIATLIQTAFQIDFPRYLDFMMLPSCFSSEIFSVSKLMYYKVWFEKLSTQKNLPDADSNAPFLQLIRRLASRNLEQLEEEKSRLVVRDFFLQELEKRSVS